MNRAETAPDGEPATAADLPAVLAGLGIHTVTTEHPAVFTVSESASVTAAIPGAHSKNLFLKDKRGELFLVVASHDTPIDLKTLHRTLGASGRLSFGSPERLREALGVEPGSVTPFAALNDRTGRVRVILDARLMDHPLLNFHPLRNTATTSIARDDLLAFLRATGHEPAVMALPAPRSPAGSDCAQASAAPSIGKIPTDP